MFDLSHEIGRCADMHFQGKSQSLQDDLKNQIVEQLQQTIIAEGQLGAKGLVALLRGLRQRRDAAKHFNAASICAALDVWGGNNKLSLVQKDYFSFVKSFNQTGRPECCKSTALCDPHILITASNLGLSLCTNSSVEGNLVSTTWELRYRTFQYRHSWWAMSLYDRPPMSNSRTI